MARVTSLYSRLDKDATAKNAAAVLEDYQHRKMRVERWGNLSLQSPQITGMPRSESYGNKAEERITDTADDKVYLKTCEETLARITEPTYHGILKYTYFVPLKSNADIMERVHLSHSAFYEARKEALVAFAGWWLPIQTSELMVYR
ncbi:ArpU family phage packaging/lysis transcriptional regulator [Lacticaseibacillus saniviri]